MMSPGLRNLVLTVHVTSSVGWIGAVMAFLGLVIAGMANEGDVLLTSVWIGMGLIGPFIIVPLATASLITGIVIALGTKWGLFQHYWVLFSLALTVLATLILLSNMQSVNAYVSLAGSSEGSHVSQLRQGLQSELIHSGLGVLVLVVIQILNIYKPRGLTAYGWRRQQKQRTTRLANEAGNVASS
jgi:hypothetical protein